MADAGNANDPVCVKINGQNDVGKCGLLQHIVVNDHELLSGNYCTLLRCIAMRADIIRSSTKCENRAAISW